MKRKNKKLLFQIGVIILPVFLIIIIGLYFVIYTSSINSFLASKTKTMEDTLKNIESSIKTSAPAFYDWYLTEWENDPSILNEAITQDEYIKYIDYQANYMTKAEEEGRTDDAAKLLNTREYYDQMPDDEMKQIYMKTVYSNIQYTLDFLESYYYYRTVFIMDVTEPLFGTVFMEFGSSAEGADKFSVDLKKHSALNKIIQGNSQDIEFETSEDFPYSGSYYNGYLPVITDGKVRAVICLVFDWTDLKMSIATTLNKALLLGLGSIIVAMIIILSVLYFRAIKPLTVIQGIVRDYTDTKNSEDTLSKTAQVTERNEFGLLTDDFSAMVKEIDRYTEEVKRITAEKEHLQGQLDMAVKLKLTLMPTNFSAFPEFKNIDLYADMLPIDRIGGDFYDFFRVDNNKLAVVIANIFDGGTVSALFMVAFKILLRHFAELGLGPAKVIRMVNNRLFRDNEDDLTLSCWYAEIDTDTGEVKAVNAGHETPLIISKDGVREIDVDESSWIIGMMEGLEYEEYTFKLNEGEAGFMYTEGVSGAENASGESFGIDRVKEKLNNVETAEQAVALVQGAINEFEADKLPDMDATMMCVKFGKEGV